MITPPSPPLNLRGGRDGLKKGEKRALFLPLEKGGWEGFYKSMLLLF
jgi:hypothetical protein